MWNIKDNNLYLNNEVILQNSSSVKSLKEKENGAFIEVATANADTENYYSLGIIPKTESVMCCYRDNPLFMKTNFTTDISEIKPETLCLLVKREDGRFLLLLPVFDDKSRGSLEYSDGSLKLTGFTGSENIKVSSGWLLYITEGENPYIMMENAAMDLKKELKSFNLRKEKTTPDYLNYLGWCTWNSFYFNVDEEKYLAGLKEFKEGNLQLGFTLVDDGWLSTDDKTPIGARTLQKFEENTDKFPNGFKALTEKAKKEYGITDFIVWHASMGYWAGCAIDKFKCGTTKINYPAFLTAHADQLNEKFEHLPVNPNKAEEFYYEFHKYLKSVGVNGLKIDVQYLIEAFEGFAGGRIKSFDTYHFAKEKSIEENFDGNAVNCMSCSNDMIYRMKNSNILRTGADYQPKLNNSYLIVSNAYNAFWLSPITYSDWDMFFSNRDDSYMEAIGRIAGGSPIYVSDELGGHDFELLKKLSLNDGRVLRALDSGRPTLDCLMNDPMKKGGYLKVFNKNYCSYILGIFNFNCKESVTVSYSPNNVEGICNDDFIAFGFVNTEIKKMSLNDVSELVLSENSADLITVSPLFKGAAVLGLKDKINRSAAVSGFECDGENIDLQVVTSGTYEIYSEFLPRKLTVNGEEVAFEYSNNVLDFSF